MPNGSKRSLNKMRRFPKESLLQLIGEPRSLTYALLVDDFERMDTILFTTDYMEYEWFIKMAEGLHYKSRENFQPIGYLNPLFFILVEDDKLAEMALEKLRRKKANYNEENIKPGV
jgi:hypothetical protein